MKASIYFDNDNWLVDTERPIDISIPLHNMGPRAWYVDAPVIEAVRTDGFIGSVAEGGPVNFRNVSFNPHGHCTHTETMGHVTRESYPVSALIIPPLQMSVLISVEPSVLGGNTGYGQAGDRVIMLQQIADHLPESISTVIIRSLPNDRSKLGRIYSGTNFPFFEPGLLAELERRGVQHFITDLPSVDREEDGGKLLAHRAFWANCSPMRASCTISELAFIPDDLPDGYYALNLQVASFDNDAAPSRPVLYRVSRAL